jgi:hypothetical protein
MKILNKKMLAGICGISTKTLNSQIKAMLSDRQIKKLYGKYRGKCFTPKQLQIIKEELGYEI